MPDVMTDADWEAEMDAETLARARQIEAEPGRVDRAAEAVKRKAELLQQTAQTIRRPTAGQDNVDLAQGFRKIVVENG